jgi:hypothetical protein
MVDKKKKYKEKYVPKSLSPADRKKQIKSIESKTIKPRPKVNYPTKRSSHVVKFEKKYGTKITNDSYISKNIISQTGINKILSKGRGAYKNNASRPNTTATQWARARLASVIVGGKSRQVDKDIWEKYKK